MATASPSSTATEPALRASMLTPLVLPGGVQRLAISYVRDGVLAVRIAFPGYPPITSYAGTGGSGHLTLALAAPRRLPLRNGRAAARIYLSAAAGVWRQGGTFSLLARPGSALQVTLPRVHDTLVRVVVAYRDHAPLVLFGPVDHTGHATLLVPPQPAWTLHDDHTAVTAAVAVLVVQHRAQVTRTLTVSDFVVSLTAGPLAHCTQVQTVHVVYHPNVQLRLVLSFPRHRPVMVSIRTDRSGVASVQVNVAYVHAASPVRIGVQATDMTRAVSRVESTRASIVLPASCRA